MNKFFIPYFLFFIFLVFSLGSCKSGSFLKRNKQQNLTVKSLVDSVEANYLKADDLMIRFNSAYSDEKSNQKIKGSIRTTQGEKFWISLSPGLGIEIAKLFLTTDSVKVLNKLKKNYFLGDYAYFTKKFGIAIDYNSIEAIFRNKLFLYGDVQVADYVLSEDSLFYSMTRLVKDETSVQDTLVFHKILIDRSDFVIKYIELIDNTIGFTTKLNYSNFTLVGTDLFPKKMILKVTSKKSKFNIKLDYTRIDTDRRLNFPFTVPSGYKRINY